MTINLYIHEEGANSTYFIEFNELGVLLGVSSDKIAPVESIHPDAVLTIFEASILSRLENLRNASNVIDVPSFDLLYAIAELKSRLFE
jgi:hypothetical protein